MINVSMQEFVNRTEFYNLEPDEMDKILYMLSLKETDLHALAEKVVTNLIAIETRRVQMELPLLQQLEALANLDPNKSELIEELFMAIEDLLLEIGVDTLIEGIDYFIDTIKRAFDEEIIIIDDEIIININDDNSDWNIDYQITADWNN